ncbi:MAG: ABC-type transport auxiliary lipoprotein family protein [Deltaproteobacteria bacterium]|nr:ABC-type transport auxiliary lipoprotein family protein [Deltaproteobacteria bacterium]
MPETVLRIFMAMLLCAVLLGGHACTGIRQAPIDVHYYTLEYDPPQPEENAPLPYVLRIDRFQASPLYDSNRIVFKVKPFKRDEYVYHKWRAQPGDLASFFLMRDFEECALFKAALYEDSVLPCTHIVTGVVEEFYQEVDGKSAEAVLTVVITLIDNHEQNSGDAALMQKRYHVRQAVADMEIPSFAGAMSAAMQHLSAAVIRDVYARLSQ